MFGALASTAGQAIGGQALKYGSQALGSLVGGRTGETIGGHNEGASIEHREAARRLNVDPELYSRIAGDVNNRGAAQGAGQSQADTAFANQLGQSNNRAAATTRMALNDQEIASGQATQLANAYGQAQQNQAQTSANLMSSVLNSRPAY